MKHGRGSIKPSRGRFWVRGPRQADGSRPSLGTYATREEAEAVLAHAVYRLAQGAARREGSTFAAVGRRVLDAREADGVRSIASERARFRKHLEQSSIAGLDVSEIRPSDVQQMIRELSQKQADDRRGPRKLSRETLKRCLTLTSTIFSAALLENLVTSNPCTGVRVRTRGHAEGTRERWAYLDPSDQERIRNATDDQIPRADRLIIRIAMGTGLRQGEQWSLELSDVHAAPDEPRPRVVVRFGSKGRPPKSGKIRTVPLFGDALHAMREWLAVLPSYARRNPEGLAFPGPEGARRRPGKLGTSDRFRGYLRAVGISRPVRWHDLRHTCASSLVAGWWGRAWTLPEVRDLLGHSSVTVTEMYAHLAPTALEAAARGTVLVTGGLRDSANCRSRLRDLNSRPTVYESQAEPNEIADIDPIRNQIATHARRYLELVAHEKGAEALALGVTLAESVLGLVGVGAKEGTGS